MKYGLKFGIVADDNTGASDAAGMLTERGVKTILVLDASALKEGGSFSGYNALVLSTVSRSLRPEEAYAKTASAVKIIKNLGINKIQIKYSSTFDSTPKGNIGPSLDAAMDVLETRAATVSPALPVNGRTTYFGYHFVNGVLLSESPLREHPLNPITDSSLVRWLQYQTKRRVGLAPLNIIRNGAERLKAFIESESSKGVSYFITDTIEQNDLSIIAEATKDRQLISGGSGITAEIPALLFKGAEKPDYDKRLSAISRKTLIVAGSCTPMTLKQNMYAVKTAQADIFEYKLDGIEVLKGLVNPEKTAVRIIEKAKSMWDKSECSADEIDGHAGHGNTAAMGILISTSAEKKEVDAVKEFGKSLGYTPEETGLKVREALASVCAQVIEKEDFGRLVVAGGETSGTVCRYLGIKSLEVGLPLEPGVPYCFTTSKPEMLVVLKSGNFGSEDFYLRVQKL